MTPDADREIAGEVTRDESIEHLQGATGHAVGSLAFLAVGGSVFWVTGSLGIGLAGFACAFLLSANGLSIYLWDRVREYVRSGAENASDEEPTRDLTGPSISTEAKEGMVATFTQIVAIVAALIFCGGVIRVVGARIGTYLIAGVIAAGNVGALLWTRRTPADRR